MGSYPTVLLMGPTAAGKTAAAVELAERLPFDIVSVDSAMVYRHLDIGSGKPDAETLDRAPHRLIDIRDPEEPYSAADFRTDAQREIEAIRSRGRIPLLVGGTGLYFRALRQGLSTLPPADSVVRERLAAEAGTVGWPSLHARLAALDPGTAARIHPNDPQRIQRALEVYELSGETMSALRARPGKDALPGSVLVAILAPGDRACLHRRIAERFRAMLACGFVDEVRALRARPGMHSQLPAARAVGYRQVWEYLDGCFDHNTLESKGIAATRQLARRQLTWLRAETGARWFETGDAAVPPELSEYVCAELGM